MSARLALAQTICRRTCPAALPDWPQKWPSIEVTVQTCRKGCIAPTGSAVLARSLSRDCVDRFVVAALFRHLEVP